MYSCILAAGYILTAVALAQVPLWAVYEMYKSPAEGVIKVKLSKESSFKNVSYIVGLLENDECFSAH